MSSSSKMSLTSSTSKQPAEKRRTGNDSDEAANDKYEKTFSKLLYQNSKIMSKLDTIISSQKKLEDRVIKIENLLEKNDNTELDKTILTRMVKNIVKILLNVEIYPTNEQFRQTTEEYLSENHQDFFKKFKKRDKWISYYESIFYPQLLSQLRSERGTLTSNIKTAIYNIFEKEQLRHITSNASPSEIQNWKADPSVKCCYNKLFKKIIPGEPDTYMTKILDKAFKDKKEKKNIAKIKIAYAMGTCEIFLNPDNQHIQMSEKVIKPRIIRNLEKISNNRFLSDDDDDNDTEENEDNQENENEKNVNEGNEKKKDKGKEKEGEGDNNSEYKRKSKKSIEKEDLFEYQRNENNGDDNMNDFDINDFDINDYDTSSDEKIRLLKPKYKGHLEE